MSYADYWNQALRPPTSLMGRGGNAFPNAPSFDGQKLPFGDFQNKSRLEQVNFRLGGGEVVGGPAPRPQGPDVNGMLGELFGGQIPAGVAEWAKTFGQFQAGQPQMNLTMQDLIKAMRAKFPRVVIPNMPDQVAAGPVRRNFPRPGIPSGPSLPKYNPDFGGGSRFKLF